MTIRNTLIALLATALLPLCSFAKDPSALQADAQKLYASLTDEQRKEASLPFDSPERNSEVFPDGKRPGIQIKTMNADQQKMAIGLLTAFTSDYGKAKAEAISNQTPNPGEKAGLDRYYVCFFGEPGEGKTYAWRIAEHHLTLVDVEYENGQPVTFGPILLGANPPVIWDEEEEKIIALFSAMSPDEKAKAHQPGKGISSFPFKGKGIRVGDLSPSAKQAAQAVLDNRLSFFSDPIQRRIKQIIQSQGGIDAMQVAFWDEATKKCKDGGRWDFKLVGPSFLCDFETSRAHIHLSMKGKLAETSR
jgi:hypothetical protein